jgi:hypothetical protein
MEKEVWHQYAAVWACSTLFETDRQMARYFRRWGERHEKPLLHLIHDMEVPDENFDTRAWGDAIIEHGPEMAKLLPWAGSVTRPCRTLLDTRLSVAPFRYKRGMEMPEIMKLCALHDVPEEDFNKALDLYNRQKEHGFPAKNIPDFEVEGVRFNMLGARFHRLAPDDMRGLFLGHFTDCCQSIDSDGAVCAEHGFMSAEAGFYVIEDERGQIIAATWAWRGTDNALVFDSLESKKGAVSSLQWQKLLDAVKDDLHHSRIDHDVTALLVGCGGNTPKDMGYLPVIPAQPIDHEPYEDSTRQLQIWVNDSYGRDLALRQYAVLIPA